MKMSKYALPTLKAFIYAVILTAISLPVFAQVDRNELKDLPPVVFINYEGPHARVDTREEIRQLGVVIGRQVSEREKGAASQMASMNQEQKRTHSYKFDIGAANRYFVIHCVSGGETDKLDADVFGLGVDTGVDHVRNLRVIIQGYLQEAYQYSASDALLLAEYITVYNAVYRGNWDYFQGRYKSQVIANMTKEKAGLSIRYDEWPGRTLMAIPLGSGGLSAIDTSAISDRRVVEEMRKEDDQSVPQRQAMVDLKEREADQASRQASTTRQEARQEDRRITEERKQTEQTRAQVQEDKDSGKITQEEAKKAEEELDKKDEELDQREADNQQRKDEADRQDRFAEQKTTEAQQERQEIARDQQAAIAREDAGVFGVTIEGTSPTQIGRIVKLNPTNGNVTRRSPLNLVHTRTVSFVGGRLLAIAGEDRGQGAVRLVEINQDNLEMAKQGDDNIKVGSLLWVNGNDLYAITTEDDKCFLGRFNTNLIMQAKSSIEIHPDASVTIQQGRLLSQRPDGTAVILDPMTLIEIGGLPAQISYSVHMAGLGWSSYVVNGATAGTTGQKRQIEAIKVRINSAIAGGIRYDVHLESVGWMGWNSDDAEAGTTGQSRQMEAVKIELTGQLAQQLNIQYRVHMAGIGWGEWVSNGAEAGTTGQKRQIEAIEIRLQAK